MAQTTAYWQKKMLAAIAANPILSQMTSPSTVAVFRLFTFVVAECINLAELAIDLLKVEIEEIASKAAPSTDAWVQNEVFKFQYSATSPQTVQLVDFVPSYAVVDESLQIITRCSVRTLPNRIVSVKVAKGTTPGALSGLELTSLEAYLGEISPAGVQYSVISAAADKLFLAADIYYDGQYAGVISANVIAAINAFLAALDFDGMVRTSALADAIQAVTGVKDVVINDLAMRADATLFANKTYLVQGYDTQLNRYPTAAGYVIEETTVGETFADKLNFIVE
jgi:hypothetical protein